MESLNLSNPINKAALERRRHAWLSRAKSPRVGDFVWRNDGQFYRLAYEWEDGFQVTSYPCTNSPDFYLCEDGTADYSGSLEPSIPRSRLSCVGDKLGMFWFFDLEEPGARRGRSFYLWCNVYEVI